MKQFTVIFLQFFLSCHSDKEQDVASAQAIDDRAGIIQEDLTASKPFTVSFYWENVRGQPVVYATSCLNTEVEIKKPYLLAKGTRFHLNNYMSTSGKQNINGEMTEMTMTFRHE